jgi:hypothetical protein
VLSVAEQIKDHRGPARMSSVGNRISQMPDAGEASGLCGLPAIFSLTYSSANHVIVAV